MKTTRTSFWIAFLLAIMGSIASPEAFSAQPQISHRDKWYDIAIRGDKVFVVGYPGLLLVSKDQGKSFLLQPLETKDALFAIDINADGKGVLVGQSGVVFTSTDAGETWQPRKSGVETSLFDVVVTPGGKAWAVGHFGTILFSDDGGNHWKEQTYDSTLPIVQGKTGTTLSVAEEENEGAIEEARLNSVSFADEETGFIVGEFGMVLHTADAGRSWTRQSSASGKLLFRVKAKSAQEVWVAGSEGTLMKTQDGGLSWLLVPTSVSEHLFDLDMMGDRLVLVGQDGLFLEGDREGKVFTKTWLGLYVWLSSVRLAPSFVLVAGGRGHLLRSPDMEKNFERIFGR